MKKLTAFDTEDERAAARKKLLASRRAYGTAEEAAAVLAFGANEEDDAERFRLRQAEALILAAERLAANKRGKKGLR